MDMDNCLKLQGALEDVFGHIIALNEELGKPMPIVRGSVLHEMGGSTTEIARLLDIVRGPAARYPDLKSKLDAEYSVVQRAKDNINMQLSNVGNDTAPYDVCARVLDDVKQVILHLVKMLEISDETFVRSIRERIKRCQDALSRYRACQNEAQASRLHTDCGANHAAAKRAVDNRLPLIEDPTPNSRLTNAMSAVMAAESSLTGGGVPSAAACDNMARLYSELYDAAGYQPPIIFEIDSDHNRAMMELAKRPYADRLKECEDKLARYYNEMEGLLARRAPPADVARVTKGIVAEVKCEAGIARELAADPAYADRANGFNEAGNDLDRHAPTFAGAAKGFCKGAPANSTNNEIRDLKEASRKLMSLFEGNNGNSFLEAIDGVAQAIALLVEGVKESDVDNSVALVSPN